MPMNPVQYQPGLSLPEFLEQIVSDEQREVALERLRCPHFGGNPPRRAADRIGQGLAVRGP